MTRYTPLLSTIYLLLAGCVLAPEVVGDTLATDGAVTNSTIGSQGPGSDVTATTETIDTVGESSTESPTEGEYGAPCELAFDYPIEARAVSLQPACDGGICLFMWDQTPPACNDDGDCEAPWSGCDGTRCGLDQDFVASTSFCTNACGVDADCPLIPDCEQGSVCVPVSSIGDLCCQKMCACADHLSAGQSQQLEQSCADPDFCGP